MNNSNFDEIMQNITAGLTGNADADMQYLEEKCKGYKDHELSQEILRACGRLMYDLLPEETKNEFAKAIDIDSKGIDAVLEDVQFNMYKNNYEKALELIKNLAADTENMFQDDQISEYHDFGEMFEEILFYHLYNPAKEIRPVPLPYTEIYYLYGKILAELKRAEKAQKVLRKGLKWNPVSFKLTSEYIETLKMTGDMELFRNETMKAFKIAFRAPDVARCFRNLGYYFTEKELYPEATTCYTLSSSFEDSKMVQSELYYIHQKTGGHLPMLSADAVRKYAKQYGFPLSADKDVLKLAYAYGKDFARQGQTESAKYCLQIVFELTDDENIKKMID